MRNIRFDLSEDDCDLLDALVSSGQYKTRAEAIRNIIHQSLQSDSGAKKQEILVESTFWRMTLVTELFWYLLESMEIEESQVEMLKQNAAQKVMKFMRLKGIEK